ncbi:MAG TPA: VIT domain-containing protein, partial [Kofleriaceae bacterium]|nr:VIT domain-containing protein [Kofleriaceae bacterium]
MRSHRPTRSRVIAATIVGVVSWGTDLVEVRAGATLVPASGAVQLQEIACGTDIELEGAVATVTMRHTLIHRGRGSQEAIYTFELPDNAAVVDASVRLADGTISTTEVIAEPAARTTTTGAQSLTARGARADVALLRLVERDAARDANAPGTAVYELRVYPLEPGKNVELTVRWVAPLRLDDDRLVLRIPGRGAAANLVAAQVALRLSASGPVTGFEKVFAGGAMRNPKGPIKFIAPQVSDLVIEATPRLASRARPLLSFATVPLDKEHGVVAVQVWSPGRQARAGFSPDRVVLVVDVSVSMGAPGLAAARTLASALLANLGDHVEV